MGIVLPQLAPASEDRVSGAQIVDGSLKFDQSTKTYLTRTPASAGNRKVWTLSYWIKLSGDGGHLLSANNDAFQFEYRTTGELLFANSGSTSGNTSSTAKFRDPSAFYNVTIHHDATNLAADVYINGTLNFTATLSNADGTWNNNTSHNINGRSTSIDSFSSFAMSQVTFIDGQALGPGYFGFTDPLTNTWRPKKFRAEGTTANDGTVWSSGTVTGTAANASGSGGWTQAFDGNTANLVYPTDSNGSTKIVLPKPIRFFSNVRLYAGQNATSGTDILVNGINLSDSLSFPLGGGWLSIDHLITSPITSLELKNVGGQASNIRALEVDGVIVTDSTTTNLAFGTNGFYLPMDGNSPIGEDKSGKGNDWTPKRFGGSVSLDNPIVSGALPILNTDGGGNVARPGVFGSEVGAYYAVTVASVGGGNRYHFDGVDRPNPTLIRGATYTFDQSDSSNGTHPLRFATAADAAGSTQYTDGVATNGTPGSAGAYTKITVPHNAPDTLYYYCTNHGNMGSSTSQITDETKADPYAWKCVLATPLVGGIDDVSADINATTTKKAATNYGSTDSSTISNFYGSSRKFDGSNDNINYAASADLGFDGDFTIECFCTPGTTGNDSNAIIASKGYYNTGNNWYFKFNDQDGGHMQWASYIDTGSPENLNINNLGTTGEKNIYHIAVTRESNEMRFYLDGVKIGNGTYSRNYSDGANNGLTLARQPSGNSDNSAHGWYDGYISDLRIYKGVAKYNGATTGVQYFVPASTNPDILPDTPSGVSGGSKLAKVTDGAVSFDGTGNYLSLASSSDLTFGTGDFTVEMLVYANNFTNRGTFYDSRPSGGTTGITIGHESSTGEIRVYMNATSGSDIIAQSTDFATGRWYHVAVTCESTSVRLFVNGVLKDTGTGRDLSNTNAVNIGYKSYTSSGYNYFNGFISNFRVLKGTALYTSNFTPPTAPLTNVTNTKLLCCQSTTAFKTGALPILNTNSSGSTTTSGTRVDLSASSLVLALPLNGSNGGTTFTDIHETIKGSGSAKTVTPSGNTQTSTAKSQYYGSSVYFDGTSDEKLSIANNTDFDFGTGDFTVEFWTYLTVIESTAFIGKFVSGNYAWIVQLVNATTLRFYAGNNGSLGSYHDFTGGTFSVNTWHHVVLTRSGSTVTMYLDGISVGTASNSQNLTSSTSLVIGTNADSTDQTVNGYMSDIRIYKGSVKYTGNFNVTAPSVEPIVAVSPSSLLGVGNAATNFNPFNTDINTVRGQETGYCTLNPLDILSQTLSDGNLQCTGNTSTSGATGTISVSSGKYYYEFYPGSSIDIAGIWTLSRITGFPGSTSDSYGYFGDGQSLNSGAGATYATAFGLGDVIGVALDLDNGTLRFYKNDIDQGIAFSGISGDYRPAIRSGRDGTSSSSSVNFGQKPFKFPPPAGFQPLNAANVKPVKVFARPDQYVGVTTYKGDDQASHIINDLNFSAVPDLVWLKKRDGSGGNQLYDRQRGATKVLQSDSANDEDTQSTGLLSFVRDGFELGSSSTINGLDGDNGNVPFNYVAWCWKAGGGKPSGGGFFKDDVEYASAAAAGLTGGTITPTGSSVGTRQGFSIIKYTGNSTANATLPHGLSESPKFVIIKNLSNDYGWAVLHTDAGTTGTTLDGSPEYYMLQLDENYARANFSQDTIWNPTSTTVKIDQSGGANWVNNSNSSYIAYLWHDVPGLQKFGTYEGSGNADTGPFVELGFKPALLIVKNIDDTENWYIYDPKRSPSNVAYQSLQASSAGAEETGNTNSRLDLLSNGFKLRQGNGPNNSNTYIYAAWAEAPVSGLYGSQSNAR